MPEAPSVDLVTPTGSVAGFKPEDVPGAIEQGFRLPSAQERHAIEVHRNAEGPLQGLAAFGEGAASALSFGIAPKLETALGITTPEAIAARKEEHPVAHGAGTLACIAAPLLLTGGAAAPAEAAAQLGARGALRTAAEFTAPALIAKAGRAVSGAVAPRAAAEAAASGEFARIVKEGIKAGMSKAAAEEAGSVAAKAIIEGAGGASTTLGRLGYSAALGITEGALYSGADVTEKALLGDPQLTWEKAAGELGLGALFGGALAGGTDVAVRGLGKLLGKATEGLSSVAERMATGDPEVIKLMFRAKGEVAALDAAAPGAAQSIAASTPEGAAFILKHRVRIEQLEGEFPGITDILSRAAPEERAAILKDWNKILKTPKARIEVGNAQAEAVQSAYSSLEDALRAANRDARPAEIEALASQADPAKAEGLFNTLRDKVDQLAKKMRAEPDLFQSSAARELELIAQGMKREVPGAEAANAVFTPADIFNLLNRSKQLVDAKAHFGKLIPPEWRRTADELKALRTEFKNALENTSVWGPAGERQSAFNAAQSAYMRARGNLEKQLMQKTTTASGAVGFDVAPTKVNSWINLMADGRGQGKSQVFNEYLRAAGNMAEQMEQSGLASAKALRQTVQGIIDKSAEIQQRATVTQIVKMLQGHEILSSGPAIPMTAGRKALELAQRLPGGVGHIVGSITGTVGKVRNPSVTVGVLATLDRLAKKASTRLQQGADAIFRDAAGAGGSSAAERYTGSVAPEKFAAHATSLRDYGSNLDRLADHVAQQTAALQDHAPAAADAAHAFAARVVQHLGAKLPDAGPRQLLDRPFDPSSAELSAYNRHHEVAARGPVAVLEHLAARTLHPDHLAASATIYPKAHAEAQHLVADAMAQHLAKKQHIPTDLRPGLSMFLGMDLDHASTPKAILSAQAAYATAPPEPGQQQPAGGHLPRSIQTHGSDRLSTSTQGNESRLKRS